MTLLEPARSVEHLIYIGFPGDPSSAIRLTRRRRLDRKKKQCERKVFQCFVFGPNNAGKSALLNCFLGRFAKLALTEKLVTFPKYNQDDIFMWFTVVSLHDLGHMLIIRDQPRMSAMQ